MSAPLVPQRTRVRVVAGTVPDAAADDAEPSSHRSPRSLSKSRRHARKLQRRMAKALAAGRRGKARRYQQLYLKSFSARHSAAHEGNRRLRKHRREEAERLPEIAAELNAWKGTREPDHVFGKPKRGGEYRAIHSFGLQGRALQHLVKEALEPFAQLHPGQMLLTGGGRRAWSAIKSAIESGYKWAVCLDVADCYSSYDARGVVDCLPAPRRVTRNVVVAEGYNIVISRFLGSTKARKDLGARCRTYRKSRAGIPPGAATSALVNEMLMACRLAGLPADVIVITYADNILILALTKTAAEAAAITLRAAFQQHPAGFLVLHEQRPRRVCDGFEFLGYWIKKRGPELEVRPSDWNLHKFARLFEIDLRLARSDKDFAKLRSYVKSWCSNFGEWEQAPRLQWLKLRAIEKRRDEVLGVRPGMVSLTAWLDQLTGALPPDFVGAFLQRVAKSYSS